MPRKPNTEIRRQQIIEAMQHVIATSGYAGATIQAIATVSGLAPGLIHYHFRDKQEILVALVERLANYAMERYECRMQVARTPQQRLRAYLDARLAYGEDAKPDAVAAWVMIGEQAVRDADVREVYQRTISREMKLIQSLLKACLIDQGKQVRKLRAVTAGLLAFIEGVFVLACNARSLVPRGFAADLAMTWVSRYMAAEPEAQGQDSALHNQDQSSASSPRQLARRTPR